MTKRLPPRGDHQPDLFAANFADIPIRDQRDTMERPFFSLAKRPRFAPIEYNVSGFLVEVSANPKFGLALTSTQTSPTWYSIGVKRGFLARLKKGRSIVSRWSRIGMSAKFAAKKSGW